MPAEEHVEPVIGLPECGSRGRTGGGAEGRSQALSRNPKAKPEAAPAAAAAEPAAKPAAEPPAKPAAETATPAPKSAAAPAATTTAKKPTSAQTAAIRSACRSDYMANCSSVPPGTAASLKCLKQNEAKLSAKCQQAVNAIGGTAAPGTAAAPADDAPGTAPAAATQAVAPMVLRPMLPREILFVLRSGCGVDARALCAGVPPGGGRIVQCLASQAASLSPECTGALSPFAQ